MSAAQSDGVVDALQHPQLTQVYLRGLRLGGRGREGGRGQKRKERGREREGGRGRDGGGKKGKREGGRRQTKQG